MDDEAVTMYVTKWWGAKGILKMRGKVCSEDRYFSAPPYVFVRIGRFAFETEGQAHDYVREAAKKKHANLLRQASKIAKIAATGVKVSEWSE